MLQKCEVAFIRLDNARSLWRPKITINGVAPSSTLLPTFLGVTYNCRLTLGSQVKEVCQQMLWRINLLRVMNGTTWGWHKQDLRTVYIATQRSVADYTAAAWAPWLSSSNIEKLERNQLQAARAITHHVRSTPTEAVLYETDLSRFEHLSNMLSVSKLSNKTVSMLRNRGEWSWTKAWDYGLVDQTGAPLFMRPCQSWAYWRTIRGINLDTDLTNIWSRPPPAPTAMTDVSKSMSRDQQFAATLAAIEVTVPTIIQVYNDGSAHKGTTDGGAGMMAMSGEDIIER